MSEMMPDSRPGGSALRILRVVGPVILLLLVLVRFSTIIADYRSASGDGETSIETTGSIEATEASGAEGAADEQSAEEGDEPAAAETEDVTQWVVVKIRGLNFRTEPKSDAEVMRTLPEGTRLAFLGEQNGWYQVRDDDGVTGWVSASSQYVELVDE